MCEVLSFPPVTKVTISRNNKLLPATELRYRVGGVEAQQSLSHDIASVKDGDYGDYLCSAENEEGKSNWTVSLVRTSK